MPGLWHVYARFKESALMPDGFDQEARPARPETVLVIEAVRFRRDRLAAELSHRSQALAACPIPHPI